MPLSTPYFLRNQTPYISKINENLNRRVTLLEKSFLTLSSCLGFGLLWFSRAFTIAPGFHGNAEKKRARTLGVLGLRGWQFAKQGIKLTCARLYGGVVRRGLARIMKNI